MGSSAHHVPIDPDGPTPLAPSVPAGRTPLAVLGEQFRPNVLARDELVPVLGAFEAVLGSSGLRRGSTVVLESSGAPGATSVALALLAAATGVGRWCAVVGLPAVGLVAAAEFGLCLDRLVLVPSPSSRPAKVLSALLEGCDIVLIAGWAYPNLGETRRLTAQARQYRSILVPVQVGPSGPLGRWPEPPDVALRVVSSRPAGVEQGGGRFDSRLVVLDATRRRMSPRTVTRGIWLPAPDGAVLAGEVEGDDHRGAVPTSRR
jgi:hypothetical protein